MNNIKKLENFERVYELNPIDTLKRIGLQNGNTVCDIGAGTGIFTLAASRMTENKVYALEIDCEMLSLIRERAKSEGIHNIELVKVENESLNIESNSIDLALIVTVLHEIKNKPTFLTEVLRMLKPNGNVAIIEFHKRDTPMGPPIDHRIACGELSQLLRKYGFNKKCEFDLGQNFYCATFNQI